jgi:aryl-alcohol dehydrogenase-like predicted oxidoreductase
MAWARQQYPYTFPIIGGVKIEHLKTNVEVSLDILCQRKGSC